MSNGILAFLRWLNLVLNSFSDDVFMAIDRFDLNVVCEWSFWVDVAGSGQRQELSSQRRPFQIRLAGPTARS